MPQTKEWAAPAHLGGQRGVAEGRELWGAEGRRAEAQGAGGGAALTPPRGRLALPRPVCCAHLPDGTRVGFRHLARCHFQCRRDFLHWGF